MIRYAVLRFGAEWGVLSERRRIGHFAAQHAAVRLALMLSLEALAADHPVELLVQDLGGQMEPYPLPSREDLMAAAAAAAPAPPPPKVELRLRAPAPVFG